MKNLKGNTKVSLNIHSIISAGMSPAGVLITIKKALNSLYGQNMSTDESCSTKIVIEISATDYRSASFDVDESHYYTPSNVTFTDTPVGVPAKMYYRNCGSNNSYNTLFHNSLIINASHTIHTSEWVECPVGTISSNDYYCMVETDLGEWAYAPHFLGQTLDQDDQDLDLAISGQVPFYA